MSGIPTKRIKAGIFSGLWDALIVEPTRIMEQTGNNNPFAAQAVSVLSAIRGGDLSSDAADTKFLAIINGISAKLDASLPPGPLGGILKVMILGAVVPTIILEGAKVYTDVNVKRPLDKILRPELAPANAIIAGWRKGEFKEKERDDKLATLGIPDEEIAMLVSIAEQNPQLANILEWYHRGVFGADENKLLTSSEGYQDFLKKADPWLLRAGVSEEDIANLYSTHWQLPGFQAVIDLFHRGLTTRDDVGAIMGQTALHPAWRDKMIAGTYQLYPLRSIANMVHVGVLTIEQAQAEYKAHGYDDAKAANMVKWVKLTAPHPSAVATSGLSPIVVKLRNLSEGQILTSYHEGLIPRAQAMNGLNSIGYNTSEAEMILQAQEHATLIDNTKTAVAGVKHLFLNAQTDEVGARSMLGTLKLPGTYIDTTVTKWVNESSFRVALPEKTDILGWYKKSLIDEATASDLLSRLGYADNFISLYLDSHAPTVVASTGA